jgi:hypothetical protein
MHIPVRVCPEDWRESLLVAEGILGVIIRFKSGTISYTYNTYLDLIHSYPKYTKKVATAPSYPFLS